MFAMHGHMNVKIILKFQLNLILLQKIFPKYSNNTFNNFYYFVFLIPIIIYFLISLLLFYVIYIL